jgi:hypothetical protein
MPAAGNTITAPATDYSRRVGTNVNVTNSSTFTTTETVTDTITVALVSGRKYAIRYHGSWDSTVANDDVRARIREDSVAGTLLTSARLRVPVTNGEAWEHLYVEYTAVSTGNKTFVVTGLRVGGTGTINRHGASSEPAYLYVDEIG